jgi:TPR repeat protein
MMTRKLIVASSILALSACSMNELPSLDLPIPLLNKSNDPDQPDFNKDKADQDSFVKVLPDYELLSPLYDLGFEGDFDRGLAAYNDKDYRRALIEWLPLAKEEDARAEYYIGIMFMHGLGLEENYQ